MMHKDDKIFLMVVVGALAFIQAGAWYMGFDGQVTIMITGIITYIIGLVTPPTVIKAIAKVKK